MAEEASARGKVEAELEQLKGRTTDLKDEAENRVREVSEMRLRMDEDKMNFDQLCERLAIKDRRLEGQNRLFEWRCLNKIDGNDDGGGYNGNDDGNNGNDDDDDDEHDDDDDDDDSDDDHDHDDGNDGEDDNGNDGNDDDDDRDDDECVGGNCDD
eukprot:766896-Hanusia_phi.AAC.7